MFKIGDKVKVIIDKDSDLEMHNDYNNRIGIITMFNRIGEYLYAVTFYDKKKYNKGYFKKEELLKVGNIKKSRIINR